MGDERQIQHQQHNARHRISETNHDSSENKIDPNGGRESQQKTESDGREPEYSLHKNQSYSIPMVTEKHGMKFFVKSSNFDVRYPLGSPARAEIENSVIRDYRNLRVIVTKEPLTVYGDGKQTRSFQYVSDLVEGLMKLMEGEHVGPFNLGNPGEFTMLELAQVVQETIDPNAKIEFRPNTEDDPHKRKPDISKAKDLLGWEPTVSLRKGLPLWFRTFVNASSVTRKMTFPLLPSSPPPPRSSPSFLSLLIPFRIRDLSNHFLPKNNIW
ncbi:hypothetical protein Csa_021705 [Cucumis sativus]|nr:hypothetical protein Csa_021705 [Cucumis sativus]